MASDAVGMLAEGTRCGKCSTQMRAGDLARNSPEDPHARLCLRCAGLDDLIFVPSGDPALTRRATRLSSRAVVAVAWNRRRKRWERRGTLVESDALAEAEAECAIDADRRAVAREKARVRTEAADKVYIARFTAAVLREFPGLAPDVAATIAGHACEKHSGRVGRTAAAKELDSEMVTLAVIAHARHLHTEYDDLRDMGLNKRDSRQMISSTVKQVLAEWRRRPESEVRSSPPVCRSAADET